MNNTLVENGRNGRSREKKTGRKRKKKSVVRKSRRIYLTY
jgi:hypothetical protein